MPGIEKYSFSKLKAFETCPYGYFLRYISGKRGESNAFAEYGVFVHKLLEDYENGSLPLDQLKDVYEFGFDTEITLPFPKFKMDLRELYYKQGLEYFSNFKGWEDKYEILAAEKAFSMPLLSSEDWEFQGIIDLVLKEKESGKLVIMDHKSKSAFKSKAEESEYARQLYLYSEYVKQEYGEYPYEMIFNMFRKRDEVRIAFNEDDKDAAIAWVINTVHAIKNAFDYPPQCEEFYGNNLCNHRGYCEFKVEPEPPKKRGGSRRYSRR